MNDAKDRVTRGACSVFEAVNYVRDCACTETPLDYDLRHLCSVLQNVLNDKRGVRFAKLLSCAILNIDFRTTQYMTKLDNQDQLSISVITNDFDRDLIADSINC